LPKSITFSLIVAILGVCLFAYLNAGSTPPVTEQNYVSVALAFFNAAAIISLFYILYSSEKETAAKFGSIVRDNIATVIVALLINLVTTAVDISSYF
jgi:hypothetical protein